MVSETTKAASTLAPHPSAAVGSPKPVKTQGDDAPAFRLPDYDTKRMMPSEFRKKIEPTQDMSFAAQTRAARTIARSKPEFSNTANLDQGSISANQPSARIPNIEPPIEDGESMAADTYKSHPNQEKQWDVSLSTPFKKPVQSNNPQGSPYTGAI